MQQQFNLIDQPWIPVTNSPLVSLRTLFSDPSLRALGGTVLEKISMYKLLLAICHAAVTPENISEWRELTPQRLAQYCLEYLEKWYDCFWLYGDKPFLQLPAVSGAELKSFATVLPDVATGNTSVLTEYHVGKPLDDAQKALLVVKQTSMALGGKKTDNSLTLTPGYAGKSNAKGKPATSKPGPSIGFLGFLHSFVMGNTLWETLWFNLLTYDEIDAINLYSEGLGCPPWEQMPEGEDCPVARNLKNSLMGRLVPMCRFILLTNNGIHLTEGIQHLDYKEGMYDPSITIKLSGKKEKPEIKVVWTDPQLRPWRELSAMLGYLSATHKKGHCHQLHFALEHAKRVSSQFGIWAGGIRVSSKAGEQYVSGTDDIVESQLILREGMLSENWFSLFINEMSWLETLSKMLYRCVSNYFNEFKSETADSMAKVATQKFWAQCESQAQHLLFCCEDTSINDNQIKLTELHDLFFSYILETYNAICSNQSARQMSAWVKYNPVIRNKTKGQDKL